MLTDAEWPLCCINAFVKSGKLYISFVSYLYLVVFVHGLNQMLCFDNFIIVGFFNGIYQEINILMVLSASSLYNSFENQGSN